MLRFYPTQWFGWVLALMLGLLVLPAQGKEFRYRYVPFKLPPGFDFFSSAAINNRGQVSGTVYKCDDVACFGSVATIYEDGTITVLQPGYGGPINAGGTIGGQVDVDPVNFTTQAALFRKNTVERIPPQPGESSSFTVALNDSGTALIGSYDEDFNLSYLLYKNGQSTVLDLCPIFANGFCFLGDLDITGMNNQNIISGRVALDNGRRGFRFDPKTGEAILLEPVETDFATWGLDINNRGDILGYSFNGSSIERIGVWNRKGKFKPYFVEGTSIPEFPTVSNRLVFNDNNLIVISDVRRPDSEVGNCYLVPKPGVRLNLADLVENLPPGRKLNNIIDINNHGDMIGFDFLLQRIGARTRKTRIGLE
jgi:hypothetical protein